MVAVVEVLKEHLVQVVQVVAEQVETIAPLELPEAIILVVEVEVVLVFLQTLVVQVDQVL